MISFQIWLPLTLLQHLQSINKKLTGTCKSYCFEIALYANNVATIFQLQGKPSPCKSLAFQTAQGQPLLKGISLLGIISTDMIH